VSGLDGGWETDWLALLRDDAEFQLISRWTDIALRLVSESFDRTYLIRHGTIDVLQGSAPGQFVTLTGSANAWASYLSPIPPPPDHHILSMARRRDDFAIDGRHTMIQHLRVLNRVLELMRAAVSRHTEVPA
jgi:hypothetical protein